MHSFHVYRGSIQGEWEDHEVQKFVGTEPMEFEIKKSSNIDKLKIMTKNSNYAFAPEVIRVILPFSINSRRDCCCFLLND